MQADVSNKECSNIDLKYQMREKKVKKERTEIKCPLIDFFMCNPLEQTQTFTLKHTILLPFCKTFVSKIYAS